MISWAVSQMNRAPTTTSATWRTRASTRSAIVMGTRKSASVRPRSAAVLRSRRGRAMVIGTPSWVVAWGATDGASLASGFGPATGFGCREGGDPVLLERDGGRDRDACGEASGIRRGEHREGDAEHERDEDRRHRDGDGGTERDAGERRQQPPDGDPDHDAEEPTGDADDPGFDHHGPPHLPSGHAGRAEDADLADPFDD